MKLKTKGWSKATPNLWWMSRI